MTRAAGGGCVASKIPACSNTDNTNVINNGLVILASSAHPRCLVTTEEGVKKRVRPPRHSVLRQAGLRAYKRTISFTSCESPSRRSSGMMIRIDLLTVAGAAPESLFLQIASRQVTGFPFHPLAQTTGHLAQFMLGG